MFSRVLVLAVLTVCFLECSSAFPIVGGMMGGITGMFVDHAKDAGIELPGYMNLLSNKSNFLTNLFHYLFGDKIEKNFRKILDKDVQFLPEEMVIEDVTDDNEEKMTFVNGKMVGLKSIAMTDNTGLEIIWPGGWKFPTAVMSIYFKKLVIKGEVKKKEGIDIPLLGSLGHTIDGPVEMLVIENNFVLTFRFHPGIFERCYLKLTDVFCTDMDMQFNVKNRRGQVDYKGGMLLQNYFLNQEGNVEEHIKTSVANMIYHEVPKASKAICDNRNKFLRLSNYQTFKKKKTAVLFDGQAKSFKE